MSLSIRLLSTALLCASIQGWPGTASAQEGRVVVRGFEGPGSARVRAQVVRALKAESVSMASTADVDAAADDLDADPGSPEGRVVISRELELGVWIEGEVERDGRVLRAKIEVIDGSSGMSLGSVELSGRNPRALSKRVGKRFWRSASDLIEEGTLPEPEPEPEPEPDWSDDDEEDGDALGDDADDGEPEAGDDGGSGEQASPFDLTLGLATLSRSFAYKDDLSGLNTYDVTGPSVVLALHYYPMAGDADAVTSHLGLELRGHMAFAVDSELGSTSFPTSANGFSVGLRARLPLGASELGLVGAYAVRSFEIDNAESEGVELEPGVPSVGYNHLRLGLDASIALGEAWAMGLSAFYLPTLSTGDVEDWFPNASAAGVEGSMSLSHQLSSLFDIVASVSFTRFAFTLDPTLEDAMEGRPIAGGATDEYISGQLGMRLSLE